MIGQHAPRLEAGRRPVIHQQVWFALLGVVLLALVAAAGIFIGLNIWGGGAEVPTAEEVRDTLLQLRQSTGGGGFI